MALQIYISLVSDIFFVRIFASIEIPYKSKTCVFSHLETTKDY